MCPCLLKKGWIINAVIMRAKMGIIASDELVWIDKKKIQFL